MVLRRWRWSLSIWLAVWLAWLPLASVQAAPLPQGYTVDECSRIAQGAIQMELAALVSDLLLGEPNGPDFDALVARAWRELDVDATLDQAVDAAVVRVSLEEDYFQRLWSGWSGEKAAELAGKVAGYAFSDPAVTAKLDEMATYLAQTLVVELDTNVARSASSALLCLQDYVGERYSATLFTAFQAELSRDLDPKLLEEGAPPIELSPVTMHTRGLVGVGVIVATEISRRLAATLTQKVAGRLAGKIAGRVLGRLGSSVIPYVGWAVGAGLLAWDLWEGAQGALPQISQALKAEEVKDEIRAEIAAAMREGVAAEVDTLAATLAASLVGQWQGFCMAHRDLCRLAEENADFRLLLNETPVTQLAALSQWVAILLDVAGANGPVQAAADGSLETLARLPVEAQLLLIGTGSLTQTLAWVDLAGPALTQVVQYEIYRRIDAATLTPLSLAAIVAIGDNGQIHKLWALEPTKLAVLLGLPASDLAAIVTAATEEELAWLAGLPAPEVAALSAALAAGTTSIAELRSPAAIVGDGPPARAPASTTALDPVATRPGIDATESWWHWLDNGIIIAAGMLVVLLVGVGVGLIIRREAELPADPPNQHG